MKRKRIALFLAAALSLSMLAGCGAKEETTEPVQETVAEETPEEPEEEPEPVYETVSYSVVIGAANEDGIYTAYDADNTYSLTLADDLSDEEKALFTNGAALKVSTEVEVTEDAAQDSAEATTEENTEAVKDASEENTEAAAEETEAPEAENEETAEAQPIAVLVMAAEALGEEESAELTSATFEKINGFVVEELADTPMYASQTVNVRSGPSQDYEQIGSLSWADEVTVTGIADTGWYQIRYNEGVGYCSNNYLVNDKPEAQQTASANTGSGSSSSTASASAGTSSGSAGAGTSSSGGDIQGALNALMSMGFSEEQARAMIDDQVGAGASSGATAETPSGGATQEPEKSTSISTAMVDAINAGREAEGLNALAWNDSLAAQAQIRAEEIVSDFSHSSASGSNASGEIIQKSSSGDVSTWYTNFYNSTGHRDSMMASIYTQAGAAVCKSGNNYYIVVQFEM